MWQLYKVTDEAHNHFYVVASGVQHASDKYDTFAAAEVEVLGTDGRVVLEVVCVAEDQAQDVPWPTFIP